MKRVLFKGKPFYIPEGIAIDDAIPVMNKAYAHSNIAEQLWKDNQTEVAQVTRAGEYSIKWMEGESKIYIASEIAPFIEEREKYRIKQSMRITPILSFPVGVGSWSYIDGVIDRVVRYEDYDYDMFNEYTLITTETSFMTIPYGTDRYFYLYENNDIEILRLLPVGEESVYDTASTTTSYSYPVGNWIWQHEFAQRQCFGPFGGYVIRPPLITTGPGFNIFPDGTYCYYDDQWQGYKPTDWYITRATHELRTIAETVLGGLLSATHHQVYTWDYDFIDTIDLETFYNTYVLPSYPGTTCARPYGSYDVYARDSASVTSRSGEQLFYQDGRAWTSPDGTRHTAFLWIVYHGYNTNFTYHLTVDGNSWQLESMRLVNGHEVDLIFPTNCEIFDVYGSPFVVFAYEKLLSIYEDGPSTFSAPGSSLEYGTVWNGVITRRSLPYSFRNATYGFTLPILNGVEVEIYYLSAFLRTEYSGGQESIITRFKQRNDTEDVIY